MEVSVSAYRDEARTDLIDRVAFTDLAVTTNAGPVSTDRARHIAYAKTILVGQKTAFREEVDGFFNDVSVSK